MFIYPENLKAKPKLWFWQLRDISIIGICLILSALALAQGIGMAPLVLRECAVDALRKTPPKGIVAARAGQSSAVLLSRRLQRGCCSTPAARCSSLQSACRG